MGFSGVSGSPLERPPAMKHFDLAVIGTGPGGQKAAIQASKLGKRVAIIERSSVVGGAAVNTGTIPSKALREAVLHLTGASKRGLFGGSHRVKRHITVSDLIVVSRQVIRNELEMIRDNFDRNNIELIWGRAHFEGPKLLQIERDDEAELITADYIVIATGTCPAKPKDVPFDDETIFTSDKFLDQGKLPKGMIVVGAGVVGTEYACIMATLGVRVTLIEGRPHVLGFLDQEIAESFQYQMRQNGVTLRLGEKVQCIEKVPPHNGTGPLVQATLESGKQIRASTLLYAVGREGTTDQLALENVGIEYDNRRRLQVNENYQTQVEHVYAVGDVIGFPALASTAMEQGRIAVCHAFGESKKSIAQLFPYGIYSVPEISMVGKTELQLTEEGIPYEAGIAQYKEITRGQLLGDEIGMLKLLIHQETKRILGVHIIGTGATELIHIGQAVMAYEGTIDFFLNNVFNYPTLAECYKVAALNGVNKLQLV
jgi:NAD(P) transhydrogenase